MSIQERYIKQREALFEKEAEHTKSAIEKQVVLLDTRHQFEDLINEQGMGYDFYPKLYGTEPHFILAFWYKGTKYEEEGVVCTVTAERKWKSFLRI